MGWTIPPDGIAICQGDVGDTTKKEEVSTTEVTIVGLDLAKRVFRGSWCYDRWWLCYELLSNLAFWDRHAAARSGFDGLAPLMKSTPSMTSARWAKPRSLRQLVSAHCATLNIICSIPGRVRQPLARLVR